MQHSDDAYYLQVREDDAANGGNEGGICYACGQLYCGFCMDPEPRASKCTACSVHFGASKHEKVGRLQKLLAEKPTGRHFKHAAIAMCLAHAMGAGELEQDFEAATEWNDKAAKADMTKMSSVSFFLMSILIHDVLKGPPVSPEQFRNAGLTPTEPPLDPDGIGRNITDRSIPWEVRMKPVLRGRGVAF